MSHTGMDTSPRLVKMTGCRPIFARAGEGSGNRPANAAPATRAASVFPLTIPRQHGAWAALLGAFCLGAVVGGRFGPETALLLTALLAAFAGRQAALLALKLPAGDPRRGDLRLWTAGYGAIFLAAGLPLLLVWNLELLGALGAAAFLLLAFTMILEHRRRAFSVLAEGAGFAGLSLAAPAAEYAAAGDFTARTVAVGLVCAAYFLGSMLHVRARLRGGPGRRGALRPRLKAGAASAIFHLHLVGFAASAAAAGLLPPLVPLAFAPATAKSLWTLLRGHDGPVRVRALGWQEAAHLVLFVALAAAAYRWAHV